MTSHCPCTVAHVKRCICVVFILFVSCSCQEHCRHVLLESAADGPWFKVLAGDYSRDYPQHFTITGLSPTSHGQWCVPPQYHCIIVRCHGYFQLSLFFPPSFFVEETSKEVSLKLVLFSDAKFYMQFGKTLHAFYLTA